jgi:hypothetical protein
MPWSGEVDDERRTKMEGEEAEAGGWEGFFPFKYFDPDILTSGPSNTLL